MKNFTVKTKAILEWELIDITGFTLNAGTESYNYAHNFENIIEACEELGNQKEKLFGVQTPKDYKRSKLP